MYNEELIAAKVDSLNAFKISKYSSPFKNSHKRRANISREAGTKL